MYNSLIKYIESADIKNKINIRFIDIAKENIEKYPEAYNLFRKGFAIPYVFINGKIKFYGGIPYELIFREILKCLNE